MFSRGTATEVTNLVTNSFRHSISLSTQSRATLSPLQSFTATYGAPCSIGFPIASSTLCLTKKSWCWPAFTGIAIPRSGKVGETHNNPLHLTAGIVCGVNSRLACARRR